MGPAHVATPSLFDGVGRGRGRGGGQPIGSTASSIRRLDTWILRAGRLGNPGIVAPASPVEACYARRRSSRRGSRPPLRAHQPDGQAREAVRWCRALQAPRLPGPSLERPEAGRGRGEPILHLADMDLHGDELRRIAEGATAQAPRRRRGRRPPSMPRCPARAPRLQRRCYAQLGTMRSRLRGLLSSTCQNEGYVS